MPGIFGEFRTWDFGVSETRGLMGIRDKGPLGNQEQGFGVNQIHGT
jgi:hypothetical protein